MDTNSFPLPQTPSPVTPPSPASNPPSFSLKPTQNSRTKTLLLGLGIILSLGLVLSVAVILVKKKAPGPKVTLTYWGLFEPASVFQQVIADYEKTHPKVKISYSEENLKLYRERLQAALARGEGPDIFRFHHTWVPMLGDFLSPVPSTVYDARSFEQTFHSAGREMLRRQGQYVAIPLEFDGLALFYNEDLFQGAGKTPPRTWGELKKTACELTVKDKEGKIRTAGVALGTTKNVDHWSDILGLMLLQNGANPANPAFCSQESGAGLEEGEACLGRDALAFFALFASPQACEDEGLDIGAVWNDLLPASTYAFATGAVAMYLGPSWEVFEIKKLNPDLKFKIVPVPQLEGKNIAWASFWVEGVSKNSQYQAEAWEFLEYLSSKEVMQKLYQTESAMRLFGEPYSRTDLAASLKGQPLVGAFVEQAPYAQSWYLASRTGDNGLNDQIIKYYEDAVNAVNEGKDPLAALTTASQGISQVLRQYGVAK